ncbi:TlpA disulfide reductase family protein [Pandoraea sp.]|uniref:TlpA family protein disulfide reductase n=1 Tax=Pandoraea sp. TaxID=1883445 RepID=UPI00121B7856|nr:TlpA disulfide reductase family protein [Pandoraea sp.]MBU6494380.1 TlpA family protein disulfide reductase [Burkholderiales bacterium]MDE2288058.1 TlpA family protein disulfide reductase [Burkholderiales bacterium]TAL52530.1 MAG: TlpA family protein disulfide reductase [Pandoraea sp.]TAM14434.1 MAG: TlpA family protein disulfide reductase [Pandoraea sp.]
MTTTSSRPFSLGKLLAAAVAVIIAMTAYLAFTGRKPAPDVTFTLLSGQKIDSAQLKGKVYLVNFWATSCTTCMQEMPSMVQTYDKYKGRGLKFIAVAMNYDSPTYVANYSQSRQLPFMVAMDSDGSVARKFGDVQLTPTTFVIGKDGKILKQYVGPPSYAELDKLLNRALGKQA